MGLALLLAAGSTGWDRAIAAEFTLKLGHTTAKDAQDEIANLFATEVEKHSAGRIKVEVYNAGQLGNDAKMNRDVRSGAQEGIIQPVDFMVTFIPAMGALQVPGLFANYDVQVKVLTGKNEASELLRKRAQAVGLEIVALYPVGFTQLATTFPIKKFEDLKGHKIRARGAPELVLETKSWGAIPIPLPLAEVYTSLQQGVVEGTQNSIDLVEMFKFYEVAKYITETSHQASTGAIVINKKWFDALPPDLKQAVRDGGQASGGSAALKIVSKLEDQAWATMKSKAIYFKLPDAERAKMKAATKPVWDLVRNDPVKAEALDALVQAVDAATK
jgi:tripartite ATP-independent transporter DctP family solute receptor